MRRVLPLLITTCTLLAAGAQAQFTLSEMLINPPGADNGRESIEIRGPANTAMTGYAILAIEGDSTGAGTVDNVIDLGSLRTGSNGLLLLRDSATALVPAPASGTTIAGERHDDRRRRGRLHERHRERNDHTRPRPRHGAEQGQ